MLNKFANLWSTNKWLFWLLLPISLGSLLIKGYLTYNKYKAEKSLENAQVKDNALKKDQDALNKKAEDHKTKADQIAKIIEDRNKDETLDLDWNKNIDE